MTKGIAAAAGLFTSLFFSAHSQAGIVNYEFICKDFFGEALLDGAFSMNSVLLSGGGGIPLDDFRKPLPTEKVASSGQDSRIIKFSDLKDVPLPFFGENEAVPTEALGYPDLEYASKSHFDLQVGLFSFTNADADYWASTDLIFHDFYILGVKYTAGQPESLVFADMPNGGFIHATMMTSTDGSGEDTWEMLCQVKRL